MHLMASEFVGWGVGGARLWTLFRLVGRSYRKQIWCIQYPFTAVLNIDPCQLRCRCAAVVRSRYEPVWFWGGFKHWPAQSSLITAPSAPNLLSMGRNGESTVIPHQIVTFWQYQSVFMKNPGQEFSIFVKTKLYSITQSVIKVFVV